MQTTFHFLEYIDSYALFKGASLEEIGRAVTTFPSAKKVALIIMAADGSLAIRSFHGVDLKTYEPIPLQEMITRPIIANLSIDYSMIGVIVFNQLGFKAALQHVGTLLALQGRKIQLLMIAAHGRLDGIILEDKKDGSSSMLCSDDLVRDKGEYVPFVEVLSDDAIIPFFACSIGQDIEGGFAKTFSRLFKGRVVIASPMIASDVFYTKVHALSLFYLPFCFAGYDEKKRESIHIRANYFRNGELIAKLKAPSTTEFWKYCLPDSRKVYLKREAYLRQKALQSKL